MNKKMIGLCTALCLSSTLHMSFAEGNDVVDTTSQNIEIQENRSTVVIRVGEYKNKPGKRSNLNDVKLPDRYELTRDNKITEYEINKYIAEAISDNLRAINPELNVVVQHAQSSWSDLNMAGKLALIQNQNVKMYLSIHTNAHDDSGTNGYMFMTGKGSSSKNNLIAERLSNSIQNNGYISQRKNNYNVDYIGELNETTGKCISVLGEFGFFTNGNDLKNLTNDYYIDYVGENMAKEINSILSY